MSEEALHALSERHPRIHCITNPVTANDCANLLLACGASPVMADDPAEVAEITTRCDGLVLNLGVLHQATLPAMLLAGKSANQHGKPIVLDPVGIGMSRFRQNALRQILDTLQIAVIRCNHSELCTMTGSGGDAAGIDAAPCDQLREENLHAMEAAAQALSRQTGAIIAATGAIDLITDGSQSTSLRYGHPIMATVSGTGCQLSALTAALVAANPAHPMEAVITAVSVMGLCGETAMQRMTAHDGNASLRQYIIDAVYNLTKGRCPP